jgi:hypothetical protein
VGDVNRCNFATGFGLGDPNAIEIDCAKISCEIGGASRRDDVIGPF